MDIMTILVSLGLAVALAFGLDFLRRRQGEAQQRSTEETAQRVLAEANKEAEAIRKEAALKGKEAIFQTKTEFEKEVKEQRREIQQNEKRLASREETIDRRVEQIDKRDGDIKRREQSMRDREQELDKRDTGFKERAEEVDRLIEETRRKLEETASLTRDEAREAIQRAYDRKQLFQPNRNQLSVILVTPLTRRSFREGKLKNDLDVWGAAAKKVAADADVPLLDLNTESSAAIQKMGPAEANTLAMGPPPPIAVESAAVGHSAPVTKANGAEFDYTHLGAKGAAYFGRMVADELLHAVPGLAPYFKP